MSNLIENFVKVILSACHVHCGGRLLEVKPAKAKDDQGEHELKDVWQWKLIDPIDSTVTMGYVSKTGRATQFDFSTRRQIPLYFGGSAKSRVEETFTAYHWSGAVDRSVADPKLQASFESAYKERTGK